MEMDKIRQYQTLNKRLTEMLADVDNELYTWLKSDMCDKPTIENLLHISRTIINTIDDNNTAIMYEYRNNK